MKSYHMHLPILLLSVALSVLSCSPDQEPMDSLIKDRLERSLQQYQMMAENYRKVSI